MTNHMSKKRKAFERKMLRRRIIFYTFTALLTTILLTILYTSSEVSTDDFVWTKHQITAEADTLWEIAENLNLDMDVRKTIYLIEEKNNITANNINIHQVIEVPTKQKDSR